MKKVIIIVLTAAVAVFVTSRRVPAQSLTPVDEKVSSLTAGSGAGVKPGSSRHMRDLPELSGGNRDHASRPGSGSLENSDKTASPATEETATVPETRSPEKSPEESNLSEKPAPSSAPEDPSKVYKVGVGDVLDIEVLNAPTRQSTLFTVASGGVLDYPLAGEPLKIGGLTTDEIGAQLGSKITSVYDKPEIAVRVREYASHSVFVTGLTKGPGTKSLRREAVPLYAVLAEAQPSPDAQRATILREGTREIDVDLFDPKATAELVIPGDIITLTAQAVQSPQYFYIGGQVLNPGQKDFHAGLTLTQAVLVAGGTARFDSGKARLSRQGADGRLTSTDYSLKQIVSGKILDPILQAGDRLEIKELGW
jgi:protein involved in polysaccharide export with SLBB domain